MFHNSMPSTQNNEQISTDKNRQHGGDGCYVPPRAGAQCEESQDTMRVFMVR